MKTYVPKLTPKAHQAVAIERLKAGNTANFDDQGLGKCKQAYDSIGQLLQENKIDLAVVITKSSLRQNFFREVSEDALQLITTVVDGPKAQRLRRYRFPSCHIMVLSFETAARDLDALKKLFATNRVFLCLDEAHYVKNPKATRTVACLELAELAAQKAIFTGTPVPNRIEDLYSQLTLLGEDVGSSMEEFKKRFSSPDIMKEFLRDRAIRRKKENVIDLKIPKKEVTRVPVKLSALERQVYDRLASELILELTNKYGSKKSIPVSNVLTKLLRLIQVASNVSMFSPDLEFTPSKIEKLDDMVKQFVERDGEKLIIWTNYRENVDQLVERYKHLGAMPLYGGLKKSEVRLTVERFKESVSHKIIVAIPACAREGFTLTTACKAIYLDRNFSHLDWAQSQDRIHRISQTRPCDIYVLEASETVDQKIDDLLTLKQNLQAFVLGDSDANGSGGAINADKLKEIVNPTPKPLAGGFQCSMTK